MHKPLVVGISGGSGSGKTTFIKKLKETFCNGEMCFISQDDYYKKREEQQIDEKGVTNFDLPEAIDREAFAKDVKELIAGKCISRQEYVFNNELATPKMLVFQPAPIVVIEGLFVFHFKEINEMLDLRVFIHAKDDLKIIRRIQRDQNQRNYPIEDVLYRYQHHVRPAFDEYVAPYKEDVDLVINNNKHFNTAMEVLTGYFIMRLTVNGERGTKCG